MTYPGGRHCEHEQIVVKRDPASGLYAVIAIHDTQRGPAVGGCRMWPYPSERCAFDDVLRLSRAMSLKSAMADLPLGGGKAVIVGDPARDKSEALLRAFGRFVEELGGRYRVGEDVGISVADVEVMAQETRFAVGRSRASGSSGDPSPLTARGVLVGVRACLAWQRASDSLAGVRVAVQGLGHVGYALCELLHAEGAVLLVSDLCADRVARAVTELGANAVAPDEILAQEVDVLAPCALGGGLDAQAIERLRAPIVAGAANNLLASPRCGDALFERRILYAPDYVINAGGIINIASELRGDYDPDWTDQQLAAIGPRLTDIFRESEATGVPTHLVADARAHRKLQQKAA
jgi:leucine dehydrogenase